MAVAFGETNRRTCCEHANFTLVPHRGREQPWKKPATHQHSASALRLPPLPTRCSNPSDREMGVARLVRFSWLWLFGETNRRTCCQHGEHANFILVPQKGREQPWEKHPSNTSTLGVSPSTPSTPNTLLQSLRPGDGRRSSGEAFMAVAVWGNEPKNLL